MPLSQSAVLDVLKVSDSADVIRQALQVILQQLIDAEATAFIDAEPREPGRTCATVPHEDDHRRA